jgi:hypothetical protein
LAENWKIYGTNAVCVGTLIGLLETGLVPWFPHLPNPKPNPKFSMQETFNLKFKNCFGLS